MPKRMPVSVVIPHYGDPGLALSLVRELKLQDYTGTIEIIVVDDHSPNPFPVTDGVRVIRHDVNSGFGTTVNTGAKSATGEMLFILNSDLHISPDFVSSILSAAESLQPAIVSPRVEYASGESQWELRRFPNLLRDFFGWFTPLARLKSSLLHRLVGHISYTGTTAQRGDWVIGAAMVLPLKKFREVNGFDEEFFMYWEEVELQYRLAKSGVPAYILPTVRVEHDASASSPSDTLIRRRWMMKSRFVYQKKTGQSVSALATVLTATSILNLVANLIRYIYNRDVKPLEIFKLELELITKSR